MRKNAGFTKCMIPAPIMKIASKVFEIVLMRAMKTVVSDVNEIDDAILLPNSAKRQAPCSTETSDEPPRVPVPECDGVCTVNEKIEHPKLVRLLQLAYSAEKAAAFAYICHAGSVKNLDEKVAISRSKWMSGNIEKPFSPS